MPENHVGHAHDHEHTHIQTMTFPNALEDNNV